MIIHATRKLSQRLRLKEEDLTTCKCSQNRYNCSDIENGRYS